MQYPVAKFDARPSKIREGKQDRSLLKLARKKILRHVQDESRGLPTSNLIMILWKEYIDFTRKQVRIFCYVHLFH